MLVDTHHFARWGLVRGAGRTIPLASELALPPRRKTIDAASPVIRKSSKMTYGPRGGWVKLDGQCYPIRAGVSTISGYSAHADQRDLLNFVKRMRHWPGEARLAHGDPGARATLRQQLLDLAQEQGHPMKVLLPSSTPALAG